MRADPTTLDWRELLEATGTSPSASPEPDAAWKELERRICKLCIQLTRAMRPITAADREDIVQEIVLKLQSRTLVARLVRLKSAEGYFVSMIKNAAVDLLRKRRVAERAIYYGDTPHFAVPLQERRLSEDETLEIIRGRLTSLSEQEAELLELRFWRELSIGEIAEKTGRSYSATAVRLFRLLKKLRRAFSPEEYLQ